MDPLRCGAGEAGAFHPLYVPLQNNTSKNGLRQRRLVCGLRRRLISVTPFFTWWSGWTNAENIEKSRGLNSLFGQGSLRIPLRLVLRPAQEVDESANQ
jgi:hypothetical protein